MNENLLHEIQTEAVDGSSNLTNLLRKCRILAQRIGNEDLKTWVVSELDGYKSQETLPNYRILNDVPIFANYIGPYQTGLNNVQIPKSAIEVKYRDQVIPIRYTQGVSEILAEIENCPDGFIHLTMDQEVRRVIKYKAVAPHLVIASVSRQMSTSLLRGILDTIRNRILNFTLELEEYASDTGDPLKKLKEEHSGNIQQVFNTNILGGVGNLNQGGNNVTQNAAVKVGDIQVVQQSLTEMGLSESEIQEFTDALETESIGEDGSWGKKVTDQLSKIVRKASNGALKVSASVATSILTELVKNYYGL